MTQAALAQFADTDTGEVASVAGSVCTLSKGAAGGSVNVASFDQAALAQMASDDTGEVAAAPQSVCDLAKGSGGGGASQPDVAFNLEETR